jgi:hypothetical protein
MPARLHTPGPWFVTASRVIFGGRGIPKEIATTRPTRPTADEAEANARLIAAAPELLEALDYLLAQTVDQDLAHGIQLTEGEQDARAKALVAIAKATNHHE